MAFDRTNKNIKNALKGPKHDLSPAKPVEDPKVSTNDSTTITANIPFLTAAGEKRKNYTFSLQPTVRKKLDTIAKEHGYSSASKFLNELIRQM
ncbi:ribbon-helix-helix domain-containing protein [Ligilactobacillus equi]|uniref:ribbon-helix-helix domain-containing protein n=1 Tax=Ligilactobacillus equi TaxID=137357 RepID=UPI002ED2FECD